ncbi:MAG: zinc-binding dehydrogenase [Aquabacterium sp.]|nr:zinc-binding dehydrogenase [Aquabacterium sp.]
MKALLLHRPGDDYALTLADVPTPIPGPGEVRLRVRASSINPVDHKFARSGAGLALPHVLGIDAAGEIDALGPEVQGWRLGDRVMALTNLYRWGGFAEQVIVDARVLSRLPDALSFERAAAIPCAGLTAWQAVHLKLNLRPGQTVLVSGAGGGVGGYVVQMAQQRGARVIGTTARSGERVRALGAEAVIDYRQGDVVTQAMTLTQGRGVDAVIDLVSAASATSLLPLLRHNGVMVCVVGRPRDADLPAWGKAISLHDVALGFAYQHGDGESLRDIGRAGETVATWVAEGMLDPQVARVISLAEVPDALRETGAGLNQGKVVIRL